MGMWSYTDMQKKKQTNKQTNKQKTGNNFTFTPERDTFQNFV
jgi:hypothetical protein